MPRTPTTPEYLAWATLAEKERNLSLSGAANITRYCTANPDLPECRRYLPVTRPELFPDKGSGLLQRAVGMVFGAAGGGAVFGAATAYGEKLAQERAERSFAERQSYLQESQQMSLLDGNGTDWGSVVANLGRQYFAYRASGSAMPGGGSVVQTMGALPPVIGRMAPAIGGAVAVGARSAASAMRAAVTWCRRNPAWCANIGGTAAVAAMVANGTLPAPRRRRGRGISSRDLRSYRRVHNLLAGFCAPRARIRKRTC